MSSAILLAFLTFVLQRRETHGQQSGQREEVEIEISHDLPEAQAQREEDAKRLHRCFHVVAEEFGVAEDESGAGVVEGVPERERDQGEEKQGSASEASLSG